MRLPADDTGDFPDDPNDDTHWPPLTKTIPFPCTAPGCDAIVDVPESAVQHDEWFDPEGVICDDCNYATIPEDVRAMRPASALDVARIEWEKWSKRHAGNKVKTTADWHLYQRAMWAYEDLKRWADG